MTLLVGVLAVVAPAVRGAEGAEGPPSPESPEPVALAPFPTGVLVEGVVTAADPDQSYTLYLPPGYPDGGGGASGEPRDGSSGGPPAARPGSPAGDPPVRRWPVLLIFDPRGRSRAAAERFVGAAERFGWILVSSDGTRSDGPWEPNVRAVNALLPELDHRFAVDPRRIYAAGFSGGAHVAWLLGRSGGLAGVIASGGRASPEWMVEEIPFAAYGAAGTVDFNYAGMHEVDAHFGARGAPHRLEIFEGVHQWMPPELAAEAVAWMEVVAMGQGRRPVDRELAEEVLVADLDRAVELEAAGELVRAASRYRAILRTYRGLLDGGPSAAVGHRAETPRTADPEAGTTESGITESGTTKPASTKPASTEPGSTETGSTQPGTPSPGAAALATATQRLAALEAGEGYRRAVEERRRWDRFEGAYRGRLGAALLEIRSPQQPITTGRLARRLEISRLRRLAGEGSTAQRRTARRLLATAFVQTAFYLHRDLRAADQIRQAVVVLEVARMIRPDDPVLLYNLACARAVAGRPEEALEALGAALGAGFRPVDRLGSDPDLESLRELESFRRLLEAAAAGEAAPSP